MISPAKKGGGKPKNTRIPRYGLEASPRKVTGNKNNQKIVALVTTITPARLIQLLERWMSGDSQPRLRWSVFSVGMLQSNLPQRGWFRAGPLSPRSFWNCTRSERRCSADKRRGRK